MDEVLSTGYLAEAEAAYQRGEVEDYFLFPAGKLKGGSISLQRATESHLSYAAIRAMFVDLERIAGVEHRCGRSFYGLRGQATDLAPDFSQDARVRASAAKTRRSMRQYLMDPNAAESDAIAA